MKLTVLSVALAAGLLAAALPAVAFPDKPIRLVIPFAPGGSASSSGRLIATKLAEILGQPVYVENIGGANGGIGAAAVARAPADGHTLFYSSAGIMTVNPALYRKLPYAVKEFEPISLTATFSSVLFASAELPVRDIPGLVAYAKANPGKVTFGSAGNGSSGHLWGEVLRSQAGIDIRHIPYRGTGPVLVDVMGGQLGFVVDAAVIGMQHVKTGKLRALAATASTRAAAAPEVPTFAEQGLPGFETLSWFGLFAPAGTPKAVVLHLQQAVAKAAAQADYQEQLTAMGMSAASTTPEALARRVGEETDHWAKVITDAKVVVE